jgi:outer membrane immunogenic protein
MRIGLVLAAVTALVATGSAASAQTSPNAFGGAYIGLNAGAAWGSSSYATDPGCPPSAANAPFCGAAPDPSASNGTAVAASGTGDLSSTGFTGGIQGGYNWQNGNIVYGGEGDFGAFDLGGSASPTGVFPVAFLGTTYALSESMSTQWLATLRARLGYTVAPKLLLYATGGIAFTDFKFASGYSDNAISPGLFPGGTGFGKQSGVATGWTLGGGGEWLLDGRWSIKAEYLYLDFGSINVAVPTSNSPAFTQTMFVDADLSAQVARVGINYRP